MEQGPQERRRNEAWNFTAQTEAAGWLFLPLAAWCGQAKQEQRWLRGQSAEYTFPECPSLCALTLVCLSPLGCRRHWCLEGCCSCLLYRAFTPHEPWCGPPRSCQLRCQLL